MTDYSDIVSRLRTTWGDAEAECDSADSLEAQAKRIVELEHQLKFECDTYLWNRKRMSRRIALLEYWMERLFKYVNSPEARRNHLTMATEIPDSLIREGEDTLHHLEREIEAQKALEEQLSRNNGIVN